MKNYLSPATLRAMELLEGYRKIVPQLAQIEKVIGLQSAGLRASTAVSAAMLAQNGLSGMFKKVSFTQKMLNLGDRLYWQRIESLLGELADEDILLEQVVKIDFLPLEHSGTLLIVKEIPAVRRLISEVYRDKANLYRIAPRDFEEMMAEYLRKSGWEVSLTKKTRDGGYDLVGLQHIGNSPFKIIAECKRYAQDRPVGIKILREFESVVFRQGANKGILFTSSYFSPDVKKEQQARLQHMMELRDHDDIMGWVRSEKGIYFPD